MPLRDSGYSSDPAEAVAEKLWAAAALTAFRDELRSDARLRTEIERLTTERKLIPVTRIARRISELLRD